MTTDKMSALHSADIYERVKPELLQKHNGDFAVAISGATGAFIAGKSQREVQAAFDARYPNVTRDLYIMGSPAD